MGAEDASRGPDGQAKKARASQMPRARVRSAATGSGDFLIAAFRAAPSARGRLGNRPSQNRA